MKVGDLVELWGKDNNGLNGPHHVGIFVGWDHSDDGWKVLVEEKIETFASTWWLARKVEDENR